MSLSYLWHTIRLHWHDLHRQFWPDTPAELTRAEIVRLDADLARWHGKLVRLRCRVDAIRQRLARHPGERLRERLARLEERYTDGCARIERRQRLRRSLLTGRMQVVGVDHAPVSEDF